MNKYDSRKDTLAHKDVIKKLILYHVVPELVYRSEFHDQSKLESPEKELFDKYTPLLKDTVYGGNQYNEYLKEMGIALDHHYENNRHHPEHFIFGIDDMTLIDVIEMFCDWKAASLRHKDGDFLKSLAINQERFKICNQLYQIFQNTAEALGWDE